ncbi:hypothetical protein I4U23_017249 [Adineta vaga]|nr:hypothetical protein I4U23_017249 [Adineta vaga]
MGSCCKKFCSCCPCCQPTQVDTMIQTDTSHSQTAFKQILKELGLSTNDDTKLIEGYQQEKLLLLEEALECFDEIIPHLYEQIKEAIKLDLKTEVWKATLYNEDIENFLNYNQQNLFTTLAFCFLSKETANEPYAKSDPKFSYMIFPDGTPRKLNTTLQGTTKFHFSNVHNESNSKSCLPSPILPEPILPVTHWIYRNRACKNRCNGLISHIHTCEHHCGEKKCCRICLEEHVTLLECQKCKWIYCKDEMCH